MPSITGEVWRQLGETDPVERGAAALLNSGKIYFREGQAVTFKAGQGPQGPRAEQVTPA